ncbi:hypothetical protein ACQJBY_057753 [Aegilops geniculata]
MASTGCCKEWPGDEGAARIDLSHNGRAQRARRRRQAATWKGRRVAAIGGARLGRRASSTAATPSTMGAPRFFGRRRRLTAAARLRPNPVKSNGKTALLPGQATKPQ